MHSAQFLVSHAWLKINRITCNASTCILLLLHSYDAAKSVRIITTTSHNGP